MLPLCSNRMISRTWYLTDPTVVVLDPLCLPRAEWQTYIDYLDDLGGEDSTPLVLLKRREDA